MAVVVKHKETGEKYILLGAGYGAYRSSCSSFFGGNLFPDEEEGEITAVAVCDDTGEIGWIETEKVVVVEIDGKIVGDII